MPPKHKFTREEIIEAGLEIARSDGLGAVTARAIAAKLETSSKPIFGIFENMEEVHEEIKKAARAKYNGYVIEGLKDEKHFKGVGTKYITFAVNEPKLFQLLFMSEQETIPNLTEIFPRIDGNYDMILKSITDQYPVSEDEAKQLYLHLGIYSHGISSLCATKMCRFTGAQISQLLDEIFVGLLKQILAKRTG